MIEKLFYENYVGVALVIIKFVKESLLNRNPEALEGFPMCDEL